MGIVASFFAGLLAGPLLGIDPARAGDANAAPAASWAPPAAPQASPGTPSAVTSPRPANPDCRDVKDTRRTKKELSKPFVVCGVPVFNQHHKVNASYTPKLVYVNVRANGVPNVRLQAKAARALERFFAAAHRAGLTPVVRSSYRSYSLQTSWYATMSHERTAAPGASEHQSGLAVDLAGIERGRLVRGSAVGASRTGKWLVEHAAEYGFILRYPTDQTKITGIAYEPWHFRYVGVKVAKGVNATKTKTLERYLKIK